MNHDAYSLVLLRHGHSEWNLTHRFTGWTDIPLTAIGLTEAFEAGQRLAAHHHSFDAAHCSILQRTRQTAEQSLRAMGTPHVPIHTTWRLNERHYGALQGMDKREIFATWGEEKSRRWWRGYVEAPPPLNLDDPRHPRFDPLFAEVPPHEQPASESLADCQRRMLPYWHTVLAPAILARQRLLIVSHGNTLRGLVMHLEGLSAKVMESVEIPSGIPLVYQLSADLTVLEKTPLT